MNEFEEILKDLETESLESLLRSARLLEKIQSLGIKSSDMPKFALACNQATNLPEAERQEIMETVITLCNHLTLERLNKVWELIFQQALEQQEANLATKEVL